MSDEFVQLCSACEQMVPANNHDCPEIIPENPIANLLRAQRSETLDSLRAQLEAKEERIIDLESEKQSLWDCNAQVRSGCCRECVGCLKQMLTEERQKREAAEKACAAMREAILRAGPCGDWGCVGCRPYSDALVPGFHCAFHFVEAGDVGKGWLSPEEAEKLRALLVEAREALEQWAGCSDCGACQDCHDALSAAVEKLCEVEGGTPDKEVTTTDNGSKLVMGPPKPGEAFSGHPSPICTTCGAWLGGPDKEPTNG